MLAFLFLALAQVQPDPTLPELVALAAADCAKLPHDAQRTARYLVNALPVAEREKGYRVLSGHVQHLSREPDLVKPYIVRNSGGMLLRVHMDDYRWKRETWEKLADVDPHYHLRLIVEEVQFDVVWEIWPGGVWKDGKPYPRGSFQHQVKVPRARGKAQRQSAQAPWLHDGTAESKAHLARLNLLTGSAAPILRADWFFNRTAAQFLRDGTGYYDFLEIKSRKDFQKLIGFIGPRFRPEARDSIGRSDVLPEPRAFVREDAKGGGYWYSIDFDVAVDKKNPLRVYGEDIEKEAVAHEEWGFLPNNFWATGAFDAKKGDAQAFAPAEVGAQDDHSKTNDKRIHVNVSCHRCHNDGGMKDFKGWASSQFHRGKIVGPDANKLKELRRQYVRNLQGAMKRDRQQFAEAVKEVTGWEDPKAYSAAYAWYWERYEDAKVDLSYAAADLGVTDKRLRAAIDRFVDAGQADTVAAGLVDGEGIGIRQYEEVIPLLRGYLESTR